MIKRKIRKCLKLKETILGVGDVVNSVKLNLPTNPDYVPPVILQEEVIGGEILENHFVIPNNFEQKIIWLDTSNLNVEIEQFWEIQKESAKIAILFSSMEEGARLVYDLYIKNNIYLSGTLEKRQKDEFTLMKHWEDSNLKFRIKWTIVSSQIKKPIRLLIYEA
jgi:hypothetical protein